MVTLENLPKEMMINILSKLPPESLFQFKSVSKFWNALINDPKNSSFLQHKHILFERLLMDEDSGKTKLILSILTLDPSMSLLDDFHLPLPFDWNQSPWPFPFDDGTPIPFDDDPDYYKDFYIQGHSHGLVCLTKYGRDIILCNPTTREIRKLPHSIIALGDPLDYIYGTIGGNAVGCGYDPKSRDFKVVRLVFIHPSVQHLRGEIFDLSKDRWREIQLPYILGVDINPSFGMYHEGTYYWVSSTYKRSFIHLFDLSEEVFDQIWLPESVEYWTPKDHMEILNGSILMFHYHQWQQNELDIWQQNELDIWKMEKDDKSGDVSWSIIFSINLLCGIERVFMFVNTNQLLITKEGKIVLYNIKTQGFKELPLKEHYGWASTATYFVKSLLSVKGGN